MRARTMVAAVLAVTALTLAGCADVVDGSGTEAAPSSSGDFPTPTPGPTDTDGPSPSPSFSTSSSTGSTGSPVGADFRCPGITYASARMTFECLSDSMRVQTGGAVFSIFMTQSVESGTTITMDSGAMLYTGEDTSFPAIAADIRVDMTSKGYYGDDPEYDLDNVAYTTVNGRKAYIVADTITYNPKWTAAKKTKVKTEKRWLLLVQLSDGRYTAWYASVPDIAKQYWPRVTQVLRTLKINE